MVMHGSRAISIQAKGCIRCVSEHTSEAVKACVHEQHSYSSRLRSKWTTRVVLNGNRRGPRCRAPFYFPRRKQKGHSFEWSFCGVRLLASRQLNYIILLSKKSSSTWSMWTDGESDPGLPVGDWP